MAHTIWLTGLPCSGKSTIAKIIYEQYGDYVILDGDELRSGLCSDLGFSAEDRAENIRRVIELCKILNKNDVNVVTAFISPLRELRRRARGEIGNCDVICLLASLEECKKRDVKGMYAKAARGEIERFTGVSDPYESGEDDEYELDAECPIEVTRLELFDIVDKIREDYS